MLTHPPSAHLPSVTNLQDFRNPFIVRKFCLYQAPECAFSALLWEEFRGMASGPRVMRGSKSVTRLSSIKGGRKTAHDARFYGKDKVMNAYKPLNRENTANIKAAVSPLRKDIERAESDNLVRSRPNMTSLQIRSDGYCEDIRRLIHHAKLEGNEPAVRALLLQR
jgi:hypothetical protein